MHIAISAVLPVVTDLGHVTFISLKLRPTSATDRAGQFKFAAIEYFGNVSVSNILTSSQFSVNPVFNVVARLVFLATVSCLCLGKMSRLHHCKFGNMGKMTTSIQLIIN